MNLFDELKFWNQIAQQEENINMQNGFVIYAGPTQQSTFGSFLNWQDIETIKQFI